MGSKIYVGGLPYSATDQQLQDLFAPHGSVASAKVITDKFTGQSRGFGFVRSMARKWTGGPLPSMRPSLRSPGLAAGKVGEGVAAVDSAVAAAANGIVFKVRSFHRRAVIR